MKICRQEISKIAQSGHTAHELYNLFESTQMFTVVLCVHRRVHEPLHLQNWMRMSRQSPRASKVWQQRSPESKASTENYFRTLFEWGFKDSVHLL